MKQANATQTPWAAFFFEVMMSNTLLVLDNYDSFTYNLVQMFKNYELEISVVRSDKITLDAIRSNEPDYILAEAGR